MVKTENNPSQIEGDTERAFMSIEHESRMCLAIITQAIRDMASTKIKIAEESKRWFESMDVGTYSLIDCCDAMSRRLRTMGRDTEIDPEKLRSKCLSNYNEIIAFRQKPERETAYDADLILRNFLSQGMRGPGSSVSHLYG